MSDDFTDILGSDVLMGVEGDTRMTPEAIFVEEYVRSGNAFMACNKSGLVDPRYPMEVMARRTLERPEIQAAIALTKELKGRRSGDLPGMFSREMLLDELQRVHEKALEDKQYASAITAVKTQAQMLGFMEQTLNINHRVSVKELSLEDLRRMVAERRAGDDAINVTPVKGIGNG
jgi:hypothetical protein